MCLAFDLVMDWGLLTMCDVCHRRLTVAKSVCPLWTVGARTLCVRIRATGLVPSSVGRVVMLLAVDVDWEIVVLIGHAAACSHADCPSPFDGD